MTAGSKISFAVDTEPCLFEGIGRSAALRGFDRRKTTLFSNFFAHHHLFRHGRFDQLSGLRRESYPGCAN
jgi:hypothetical protein